jgi:hypothetical protein
VHGHTPLVVPGTDVGATPRAAAATAGLRLPNSLIFMIPQSGEPRAEQNRKPLVRIDTWSCYAQFIHRLVHRLCGKASREVASVTAILGVAVDAPLRSMFDYRAPSGIPREGLRAGQRVWVPFGARRVSAS